LRPGTDQGYQLSFFLRMVYSCLVDADWLDTEAFCEPQKAASRQEWPSLADLWQRLESHLQRLQAREAEAPLNQWRNQILRSCLAAADNKPGVFSLTVPTGGGKTFSSLAFAVRHAMCHGQGRVIYAIPYTSIIEQNAAVFRAVLGEDAVLEHHSNLAEPGPDEDPTAWHQARLAAENWDASLVVTTNVQLFESLYANRPSRCRKLHNIAGSVIILDEAQMLPRQVLLPCLEALRELALNYHCTVVLCTATQPALADDEVFRAAALRPREIAPEPACLYRQLRRVEVVHHPEPKSDAELASLLAAESQVLCVVNTRRQARDLFLALRGKTGEGCFHLSALMYPGHRARKLAQIREALAAGLPCRVVSTQLVEAGVDVDFPVVWRALAGVDSLAQAAGRCNREGRLLGLGRLHVFHPADHGLPPDQRPAAEEARSVLRGFEDPLCLEAVEKYFNNLFWRDGREKLDRERVLPALTKGAAELNFQFAEAARRFRCFDSPGEAVLVFPDEARRTEFIQGLQGPRAREWARRAQPFAVQLYPHELARLEQSGEVARLGEGLVPVLINLDLYDEDLGLRVEDSGQVNPDRLVV
jgi:CRISPR-associated endonuclease/helicase Cas3